MSFEPKEGRQLESGMRVRTYVNLNRPGYISIMLDEGPDKGKIAGYARCVKLDDITFQVSAKGQERVRRQRRKAVHAFAKGTYQGSLDSLPAEPFTEATYCPYSNQHFVIRGTQNEPQSNGPGYVAGKSVWLTRPV